MALTSADNSGKKLHLITYRYYNASTSRHRFVITALDDNSTVIIDNINEMIVVYVFGRSSCDYLLLFAIRITGGN